MKNVQNNTHMLIARHIQNLDQEIARVVSSNMVRNTCYMLVHL